MEDWENTPDVPVAEDKKKLGYGQTWRFNSFVLI